MCVCARVRACVHETEREDRRWVFCEEEVKSVEGIGVCSEEEVTFTFSGGGGYI